MAEIQPGSRVRLNYTDDVLWQRGTVTQVERARVLARRGLMATIAWDGATDRDGTVYPPETSQEWVANLALLN